MGYVLLYRPGGLVLQIDFGPSRYDIPDVPAPAHPSNYEGPD